MATSGDSIPFVTGGGQADEQPSAEGVAFEMSQMQQVIVDWQAQIASLQGATGQKVADLENQVGQTQAGAQQAAAMASQATASSAATKLPFKPIRPPRFKGNTDGPRILEWLHQAELYLRAMKIENDEAAIFHISSFFEADAAVWWRHYYAEMEAGTVPRPMCWADMKQLLTQHFQIFNHDTDVRDRYQALRQTGSVSAYIAKFRGIVVELREESETGKLYQFLRGLKPEIQKFTRTQKPRTVSQAMDIADEADRVAQHTQRTAGFPRHPQRIITGNGAQPMQLGVVAPSPAEVQRLRERNACFYCRKQGHQARNCLKKKADLAKNKTRRGPARKADF